MNVRWHKLRDAMFLSTLLFGGSLVLVLGIWGLVLLGDVGAVILFGLCFAGGVWALYDRSET